MHSSPRHRHFIAVPVAIFSMAVLACVHALMPVHAQESVPPPVVSALSAGDAPLDFMVSSVLNGRLEPNSRLSVVEDGTVLRLDAGEISLRAFGAISVESAGVRIETVMADISVITDETSVSIVALNAPVFVIYQDVPRIIRAGHQLFLSRDNAPRDTEVPTDWLAGRISLIESQAASTSTNIKTLGVSQDVTVLAQSLRAEMLSADHVQRAFVSARKLDADHLPALLLQRLLMLAQRLDPSAAQFVLSQAFTRSDSAIDMFLAVPEEIVREQRPLLSGTADEWAHAVIRIGTTDASKAVHILHQVMSFSLPATYVRAGYPVQAMSWSNAFTQVKQVIMPLLSEEDQSVLLQDFVRMNDSQDAEFVSDEEVPVAVPAPAKPVLPRFSEDELVALTKQLLIDHGVLISTLTHVEAISGKIDQVHVEGVFLPENGKDVPYTFTFDAAQNVIRNVVRDGVRFPNAVPVDTFFR
jgi:hypothetical protein